MKKLLSWVLTGLLLLGSVTPVQAFMQRITNKHIHAYGNVNYSDEIEMRKFLATTTSNTIKITINSPGGMATVNMGIIYTLEQWKAAKPGRMIITEVTGHALSAAAILFLIGDIRICHQNSVYMVHKAWLADDRGEPVPAEAIPDEHRRGLEEMNTFMINRLSKIVGESTAKQMVTLEGTWLYGPEILAAGLATKLLP